MNITMTTRLQRDKVVFIVKVHTAINRADFVSWWMWFNGSPTKARRHFLTECILLPSYVYNMHQDTKSARLIPVCKRSGCVEKNEDTELHAICPPSLSQNERIWVHKEASVAKVSEIFLKTRTRIDDDYDFITSAQHDVSNWRQKWISQSRNQTNVTLKSSLMSILSHELQYVLLI